MVSALSAKQIAGLMGVDSALSFGGNLLTSAMNASRQWKYTRRAMELADRLNRSYTHDVYSIQRSGLVDAGYNPLLALGTPASGAIYGNTAGMADSDNGAQAVENGLGTASALSTIKLQQGQAKNLDADTDVKKYGQKGAILKNLVELANNPKTPNSVKKAVSGEVVRINANNVSAISNDFFRQHPTTATVLRKLRQGDFRGAKYAMDLRRERIKNELRVKSGHSAVSSNGRPSDIPSSDWFGNIYPDKNGKYPVYK